jgi:hypothetical protein
VAYDAKKKEAKAKKEARLIAIAMEEEERITELQGLIEFQEAELARLLECQKKEM